MVTVKSVKENEFFRYECYGKSTDEKPTTNMTNGSTFYEMDTKKLFMFDEESRSWIEQ